MYWKEIAVPGSGETADTIRHAIARHSATQPDRPAIVSHGLRALSYQALHAIIRDVESTLQAAGYAPDAKIAIAFPNGPYAALAIVAISCCATAIPINPKQTADEIETCLNSLRPDAVLALQNHDTAARRLAERHGIPIIEAMPAGDKTIGFTMDAAQRPMGKMVSQDEPRPESVAFILQTSGTSAKPKSIPFTHRNMLAAAARLQAWFSLTCEDRCLGVSPVYYSHGLKVTVFTPLITGGSVAFPEDPTKFDQTQWFKGLKPTWYSAGPTLHRLIFDQMKDKTDGKTAHSLRFLLSGGAPLPADVREGLQQTLGVPVLDHYGSSEAAQIAANLVTPGRSKPGTCGIPWPGTLRIADEDGKKLPQGEQGEILLRGPTLTSGYLGDPQLNKASFVDGWFKTGDIGSIDRDGFLTIHGRKNDIVNRGGEKIWPGDVDSALLRHPAIADAAAFAVPHPQLGEDVAAAIVLKPGMTVDILELRNYLSEKLAAFKIPRQITVVNELPKGATGKVQRRRLTETFKLSSQVPAAQAAATDGKDGLSFELTKVWRRLLNSASFGIDDDFFEIGGDSLLAVEMICEIEQIVGHAVSMSILFEAATIRQLADKLTQDRSGQTKSIVQISPAGQERPFFYIHGDPGGGNYVKRLSKVLGSDQSLFAIAPHGADKRPIRGSIEEMAAENLALIREKQPHGPYRLGGYCTSALVAFEVARLLIAEGETVEVVAMVDPPTFNAHPLVQTVLSLLNRSIARNGRRENEMGLLWYYISKLAEIADQTPAQISARIKNKFSSLLVLGKKRRDNANMPAGGVSGSSAAPAWGPFAKLPVGYHFWKYSIAMARYLPKPLAVPVTYFSADHTGRGWRRITSDLEVIKLSGDHLAVIIDPTDLATHLQLLLRGAK